MRGYRYHITPFQAIVDDRCDFDALFCDSDEKATIPPSSLLNKQSKHEKKIICLLVVVAVVVVVCLFVEQPTNKQQLSTNDKGKEIWCSLQ
jgi:hypothetical protein